MIRATHLAPLLTLLILLTGCAPYTLRGRVVEGELSYIAVVGRDDPRLQGTPIPNVQLDLTIDPTRLNRTQLPMSVSGVFGEVSIPVRKTGAGLLEYEASLAARRPGYQSAEGVFPLPGKRKRVLVVLTPGRDPYRTPAPRTIEDDLRQFDR